MGEDQPVMVEATVDPEDVSHVVQHLLDCPSMQGGSDDISKLITLVVAAQSLGLFMMGPNFVTMTLTNAEAIGSAAANQVTLWMANRDEVAKAKKDNMI